MKNKLALGASLLALSLFVPTLTHAEENSSADSLVQETEQLKIEELTFDVTTRILSGKTNPHTNIYLNNLAEYFSADENGHFTITVPATIETTKLIFLDALTNQSVDFDYTFKKGSNKQETKTSSPEKSTSATQSEAVTTSSKHATISSEVPSASAINQKNKGSFLNWDQLLYPLVLIGIGLLFLVASCVLYLRAQRRKQQRRQPVNRRVASKKRPGARRPEPKGHPRSPHTRSKIAPKPRPKNGASKNQRPTNPRRK